MRGEIKVVPFADKLNSVGVDKSFELVVLEAIHEQFLVDAEAFAVEEEDASEGEENLTLLIVVVGNELFVVFVGGVVRVFFIEFDAGFKGAVDDLCD